MCGLLIALDHFILLKDITEAYCGVVARFRPFYFLKKILLEHIVRVVARFRPFYFL